MTMTRDVLFSYKKIENLSAEDLLERKQDDLKKNWVPARAETGQAGIELDDAFKGE